MTDLLLRFAYAANIVILLPVVGALALTGRPQPVFGSGVPDSPALRTLVMSLWGAILVCSIGGLIWPGAFVAILVLQVLYKSAWLVFLVAPQIAQDWRATPWGPALTFVPIVLAWPFIVADWAIQHASF